ncbi:MAG: hypothetical protein HC772_13450, partial [Leptolyngbyaceae cyanobacterium CRU_2_3]|nr:hypothetical protein [Leptolyngbyaceae cyanobacterium CRU_2_3]
MMRPFDLDLEAYERKLHMPSHLEPTVGKGIPGCPPVASEKAYPGQGGFSVSRSCPQVSSSPIPGISSELVRSSPQLSERLEPVTGTPTSPPGSSFGAASNGTASNGTASNGTANSAEPPDRTDDLPPTRGKNGDS